MNLSAKAQRCKASPIRKYYPYQVECLKRGIKMYHLNIGQPDIATPEAYFDVIHSFDKPVLEYAPSPGIPKLIEATKDYYAGFGISLTSDDILITTGGSEALSLALACILDDGDEVIVPEPFYPNYTTFVNVASGHICPLPTYMEDGYNYASREQIVPLINKRTRAILVTNPGNPTGSVLTKEEMRTLADIAKEYDLFLISDEVYREFIYDDGVQISSMAEFTDIAQNVVIIDSVSKRFSACGARIGALITRNREFQANVIKLLQARLSVATIDQLASAALYSVDPTYFEAVRIEYKARRDLIQARLSSMPGVSCVVPQGAFYLMAKLPVKNADDFQTWLLTDFSHNNETIMFAPGSGFYATPGMGLNEARFAYVLNCADIARAMDLLETALAQYRKVEQS